MRVRKAESSNYSLNCTNSHHAASTGFKKTSHGLKLPCCCPCHRMKNAKASMAVTAVAESGATDPSRDTIDDVGWHHA